MPSTPRQIVPTGVPAHREGVDRLLRSYRNIPGDAPVRLAKKTSNLFRARAEISAPGLDVSGLGGVISVDPKARTADVAADRRHPESARVVREGATVAIRAVEAPIVIDPRHQSASGNGNPWNESTGIGIGGVISRRSASA